MLIEIWSDVACPWCAIGRARLTTALADFPHAADVEIRWRSFELDPSAPPRVEGSYVDKLARKYRVPERDAQAMIDRMTATAAEEGLAFRFDIIRAGNTFDAHRLIHLGADHELQHEVKARLLRGYLEEGEPIGEHEALRRLAVEAGLDPAAVDGVLDSDRYADAVRSDESAARELGISGVPFFVFDRRFGLSGAQPPAMLRKVLDHAWAESEAAEPATVTGGAHGHEHGDACADGSCAI